MNSNEKKPNVSIAIPKAKPKMERVSPGVYRNSTGNLVRSATGQASKAPEHRFLPRTPGSPSMADAIAAGAKPMATEAPGGMDANVQRLIDLMGGSTGPGAQPIPKMPGRNIDPGYAASPMEIPPELRRILDGVMNKTPSQTPPSGDSIADLLRRR